MPISLSQLQRDKRTCTVAFDGETAEVTYKPSAYTPDTEDAYQREIEKHRPSGGAADLISELVIRWEVVDENGEELPVEPEILRKMPSSFLFTIMGAIIQDLNTERDDRKNSGGGSPQRASKENARNGTRSSGRRGSLA